MWQEIKTKSAPSPRVGASFTKINSSQIILIGGASHEEGPSNSVYSFHSHNMEWQKIDNNNILPPRYDHASALIRLNEKDYVLVFGGCGETGVLNDVWLFDVETGLFEKFVTKGCSPTPRTNQHIVYKRDLNRIYVFGGSESVDSAVKDGSVYCLNLNSAFWIKVAQQTEFTPSYRFGHSFTPMNDKEIVLFGGMDGSFVFNDLWTFNIVTNKWEKIQQSTPQSLIPPPRSGHAAFNFSNSLIIYGGLSTRPIPTILEDIYSLDMESKCWTVVESEIASPPGPPGPRLDFSSCLVEVKNEGKLKNGFLVFGGMDFGAVMNDVFIKVF